MSDFGMLLAERDTLRARLHDVEIQLHLLESAIRTHRDQKADDRCILDDDTLYAALGDGIPCDRRVGDKAEMLKNCQRFIERRCEAGGWPAYRELEDRLRLAEAVCEAQQVIDECGYRRDYRGQEHAEDRRYAALTAWSATRGTDATTP